MKVYVASSWRTPTHPEVVAALRSAGHEVYDYRTEGFEWSSVGMDGVDVPYDQLRDILEHDECVRKFEQDENALDWAEALVLVLPAGRSAHTEFGYMCGRGVWTVVIWSPSEPDLLHMMADRIVETVDEAVAYLATDIEETLHEAAHICGLCECNDPNPDDAPWLK